MRKKDIARLEIEQTENGFVLWVTEKVIIDGKKILIKHWLLDGSCLKDDLEIRLGSHSIYKIEANYKHESNSIIINRDKLTK